MNMPMVSEVRVPYTPSARYPDPAVELLDEDFLRLRLFSAGVDQLTSGLRWAEGPQWFGDGRYLLFSDIPNDRILRWDECSGATSVFRSQSNLANGPARDRQGRAVGHVHLPERCANVCFGGAQRNRLFMASSHSLYALFVDVQGAVP